LLPLEDPAAQPLLESLPEQERGESWHLALPEGRVSSRGAVAADLVDALGYRRTSRTVGRLSGPVEKLYTAVAEHRDRLGRFVPDGPAPHRFP
jgi:hypothetical protein